MDLSRLFADCIELPPPPGAWDPKGLPAHGGVWLLTDEGDRPIQLGGCESLRRTVRFRLDPPAEEERRRQRADLRAIARRVWWWPTHSQFETAYDYYRIARELYPDDYLERVAFGPTWFAEACLEARIPRLRPMRSIFRPNCDYFGPFQSRSRCIRYIDVLEELYGLCRCVDILEQAPNGRRCAYADMGKCPAPCDGSFPMEQYRQRVADAVGFVRRGPAAFLAATEEEMKRAADAQEYEQAAALKRRIDEARKSLAKGNEWVDMLERFRWLIVQRGPGRTTVKPFFVRDGWIDRGEVVKTKKLKEHVDEWLRAVQQDSPNASRDDERQRTEHVWLVSCFLFRSEKVPGVFLRALDLPRAEDVVARVREAFPSGRSGKAQSM